MFAIKAATAGRLLVVEVRGSPARHRHPSAKTFYFLAGEFELTTADDANEWRIIRAGAGDTVAIPAMAWHNLKNVGTRTGRFIGVHGPPLLEPLIREPGQPIDNPFCPPQPAGPPSDEHRQHLRAAVRRYIDAFETGFLFSNTKLFRPYLFLLLLSACTRSGSPEPLKTSEPPAWTLDRLYFGRSIPNGGQVTEQH